MLWSVLAHVKSLQSSVLYLVLEADPFIPVLTEGVLEAAIWSPSLQYLLPLLLYSGNVWYLLLHSLMMFFCL
jgi:hypothetical protein